MVNALHITMIRRIFAICQDAATIVLHAGKRCANWLANLKHASQLQPAFMPGCNFLGGWADTLRPTSASLARLVERYRSASAMRQTRQMAVARVARATVVR